LRCESHQLHVEQTILEDASVGAIPVYVEVVDHVVFGKVLDGDLAERVAEADQGGAAGRLREVVVAFRGGVGGEVGDGVEVGEDGGGRRGAVVEEEDDGAGDGVDEVGGEAESVEDVSVRLLGGGMRLVRRTRRLG
jgi:hypothetical protein